MKPTIHGANNLRQYINQCNMPYFKIVIGEADVSKKSALATNYDKDNQTPADVIRDVDQYLDTIRHRGGDFIIWLSSKPNNTLPEFRQYVEIPSDAGNPHTDGIGSVNSGSIEEMIAKEVAKAQNEWMIRQELKEKEKEIAELKQHIKENTPTSLDRIAERMEPYIGTILKSVFPQVEVEATSIGAGKSDQAQEITEKALTDLFEADPEFYLKLLKLNELRKKNPQMYSMAVNMLENQ